MKKEKKKANNTKPKEREPEVVYLEHSSFEGNIEVLTRTMENVLIGETDYEQKVIDLSLLADLMSDMCNNYRDYEEKRLHNEKHKSSS